MTRDAVGSGIGIMIGLTLAAWAGCGPPAARSAAGKLPVFVGIPPLAYLVEQIGGPHVRVGVLMQPGQDPHTFEPTPQQVLALNKARLFFEVGMPFERILAQRIKEGNQRISVVDAAQNIQKRILVDGCADKHLETPGREDVGRPGHPHPAGEPDPHVWLSPRLLKKLAENVAAALERADPADARAYAKELAQLSDRLDTLDAEVGRRLAPYRGRRFYVFHPGFGYFAEAYGLHQVAIEEDGRQPTPKQLQSLIACARNDHVRVIFVQPQSPQQSAEVIAEAIGGKTVMIDGLAKDVPRDIDDIADKLAAAFKNQRIESRSHVD